MKEAKIIYKNGYPFFEFDNKEYSPCMFRSFRPTPANVSLAYRAGVRVFQIQVAGQMNGMDVPYSLYGGVWQDEDVYNFKNFDRQIGMFKKFAPEAKFIIFIQLDSPEAWLEKHKESLSSFYYLNAEAYDEVWKEKAAEFLKIFLEYCEKNYDDDIIGFGITAGRSTEWFSDDKYYTPNMEKAYKNYLNDQTAKVPKFPSDNEKSYAFYSPLADEYKFLKFAHQGASVAALFFAKEAQKVIKHKKPLGLFGGYYLLKNNSLHVNDFTDVWNSEDIDMIWAPAAYDTFRKIENSSCVTVAAESLKQKGMFHVNELDHRTPLAAYPMEHPVAKERWNYRMTEGNIIDDCYETSFETIMVLRRELASSLMHSSLLWWFDFFGGYYAAPEYEKMLSDHINIYLKVAEKSQEKESIAEVAIFVDSSSNTFIRDDMNIHASFTYNNMVNFTKCAIPYDLYNLSDFENTDTSKYKLCIFLNSFYMSKEQLKKAKAAECNKLWVYAPNVMSEKGINYDEISKACGINIKAKEEAICDLIEFDDIKFGFEKGVNPMFYVDDADAEYLGFYEKSSLCAIAYKNKNYYCSMGNIPTDVWRKIAKRCNVHIYANEDGAFFADNNFISYQTMNTSKVEIHLKEDDEFEELFDGGIYKSKDCILKYDALPGTTKLFLKRRREES